MTTEIIIIDGVKLEGCIGINTRRDDFLAYLENTNGCGAGNAKFDFVPDTIWGLDITPICNLHDDHFVFCGPHVAGFNEANKCFKNNLIAWNDAKSNWLMKYPRRLRIETYYKMVSNFGWSAFVDCKTLLNQKIWST